MLKSCNIKIITYLLPRCVFLNSNEEKEIPREKYANCGRNQIVRVCCHHIPSKLLLRALLPVFIKVLVLNTVTPSIHSL